MYFKASASFEVRLRLRKTDPVCLELRPKINRGSSVVIAGSLTFEESPNEALALE